MAEVKLTMTATEHQLLLALLNYWADKIDDGQLHAILASCGYKSNVQVAFIAEQLVAAIQ